MVILTRAIVLSRVKISVQAKLSSNKQHMTYRILKIFLHIELISREFVKFNRSTDMFEILFHSGISKNL